MKAAPFLRIACTSFGTAFTVLVPLACGGASPGLNQTSVTCPAGRTLLDGVCVAEQVADYVACVRAQGAQLGGESAKRVSADVGTMGVRAAGAAEVKESMERKYSVSDAATMEVIKSCSAARSQVSTSSAPPVAGDSTAKGHELFYDGKRVGTEPSWNAEQSTENCVAATKLAPNSKVECAFNGKRYLPTTPSHEGVAVKGYELMYDGKRVGYERNFSRDQSVDNCRAAVKLVPNVKVECAFDGKRFSP